MSREKVAVEVTVRWLTRDDAETAKAFFEALDAAGVKGPADYVSLAIHKADAPFDRLALKLPPADFDIEVDGPIKWAPESHK
jgi:hypothetical protein